MSDAANEGAPPAAAPAGRKRMVFTKRDPEAAARIEAERQANMKSVRTSCAFCALAPNLACTPAPDTPVRSAQLTRQPRTRPLTGTGPGAATMRSKLD